MAKHPHDPAPGHSRQASLAQQAKLALQLRDSQPEPVDLTGPTAEELRRQLNDLPAPPEGDTEPHATVVKARDDLSNAEASRADHRARRPPDPQRVHTGGLDLEDIRVLIADLSWEEPQVDPSLQGRTDLTGPTAEELRRQLDDLPAPPEGDTEPHATVVKARDDLSNAEASRTDHRARRPPDPQQVHTGELDLEDIRVLIADLSLEEPQVDPSLQGRSDLTGPTAEELRQQLNDLPAPPEGDTEPHATVVKARDDLSNAEASRTDHRARRPPDPQQVHTGELDLEDIRVLIADLSLEEPQVDPGLQGRIDRAQARVNDFKKQKARKRSGPFAWLFRLIAAILALFKGKRTEDDSAGLRAEKELAEAKDALGEERYRIDETRRRKADAAAKAADNGLRDDPEELRALVEQAEEASRAERDLRNWSGQEGSLRERVEQAKQALEDSLCARGVADLHPVDDALDAYEVACKRRAEQLREASRRQDLERALASRLEAETAARQAALGEERLRIERQRKKDAAAEAADNGLPDNPEELRALAAQVEEASRAERDLRNWSDQESSLRKKVEQAKQALEDSLCARGVADLHPVDDALDAYEAACKQRAEQLREASRRQDLERALASRLEAETAARQAALGEKRLRIERQRKKDAAAKAADNGLPDDPEELRAVARQAEEASRAQRDLRNWSDQEGSLREKAEQAEQALVDALGSRGVTDLHPAADALATYEAACAKRTEQYREASRRPDLEQALKARKGEEAAAAEAERQRSEAADALRQAGEGARNPPRR